MDWRKQNRKTKQPCSGSRFLTSLVMTLIKAERHSGSMISPVG
jgi:hypothetical protein